MTFNPRHFIGLDIECTGADVNVGHKIIDIGIAIWNEGGTSMDTFSSFVAIKDETPWSTEAAHVHGLTRRDLMDAPRPQEVETDARRFLKRFGLSVALEGGELVEDPQLLPVGFNVGSFDMCFINAQMPLLGKMFSHRQVELNSPLFTLALSTGRDFKQMKDEAKTWAAKQIPGEYRPHSAVWDAQEGLWTWKYMQEHMHEWSTPHPHQDIDAISP